MFEYNMPSRKTIDIWIVIPTVLLVVLGIMVIGSVSPDNLSNHLIYLGIGIGFFVMVFFIDRTILYSLANYLYVFGLIGLILPLIFGTITRGSVRWINLGAFTVQPSEIIKSLLALCSAVYWTQVLNFSWKKLLFYLIIVIPAVILVLIQPDLGSALVISVGIGSVILFSGISPKQLIMLFILLLSLIPVAWFSLHDYQHQRILNFINPYQDPLGTGYNAIQAKIAVGSGILTGRGIGQGTQSHLAFLPERTTDFIFASYAEEVGFIGSMLMVAAYLLLISRLLYLLSIVSQKIDKLVIVCLTLMVFFQTIVNIGMNIGIVPIAGITLPLVSYGGSSLVVTFACLGLICNISSGLRQQSYLRIQ